MSALLFRYISVGIASFVAGGLSVGIYHGISNSITEKHTTNNILNDEIPDIDYNKEKARDS